MEKRGVSPIIATILLIAISVVLIALVYIWLKGFGGEAIQKKNNPAYQACEKVSLTASYRESNNELVIENNGNVAVYSLEILVTKDKESTRTPDSKQILVGDVYSITLSESNPDLIQVYPILLGTNEENEKRTYLCDKNPIEAEII